LVEVLRYAVKTIAYPKHARPTSGRIEQHLPGCPALLVDGWMLKGAGIANPVPTLATPDRAGDKSALAHHTAGRRLIPGPRATLAIIGSFQTRPMGVFGGVFGLKLSEIRQLTEKVVVFVLSLPSPALGGAAGAFLTPHSLGARK
jgi:hypothetical protein